MTSTIPADDPNRKLTVADPDGGGEPHRTSARTERGKGGVHKEGAGAGAEVPDRAVETLKAFASYRRKAKAGPLIAVARKLLTILNAILLR